MDEGSDEEELLDETTTDTEEPTRTEERKEDRDPTTQLHDQIKGGTYDRRKTEETPRGKKQKVVSQMEMKPQSCEKAGRDVRQQKQEGDACSKKCGNALSAKPLHQHQQAQAVEEHGESENRDPGNPRKEGSSFCGPARPADDLTAPVLGTHTRTNSAKQKRRTENAQDPSQQGRQAQEASNPQEGESTPRNATKGSRRRPVTAPAQDALSPLCADVPAPPEGAHAPHQSGRSSERKEEEERSVTWFISAEARRA
ncbi:hypothetical protein Emag_007260 [Eimeria magna]